MCLFEKIGGNSFLGEGVRVVGSFARAAPAKNRPGAETPLPTSGGMNTLAPENWYD